MHSTLALYKSICFLEEAEVSAVQAAKEVFPRLPLDISGQSSEHPSLIGCGVAKCFVPTRAYFSCMTIATKQLFE